MNIKIGFSNHLEDYGHGKALEKDIKIKLITSQLTLSFPNFFPQLKKYDLL